MGLGRLKPPKRHHRPLTLVWELVFLHCCFEHHSVVIEGYLFVVFCVIDIIIQMIALRLSTTAYLPLGHLGHATWPKYLKKLQLLGTSSHKAPTRALPMDHTGTPKFPSSSSLSCVLSLRLCFSNDVSEAWIHGCTHIICRLTAKNWDQLRDPTLGSRVWATFIFLRVTVDGVA